MLVATVLGKIISLYRAAVNDRTRTPNSESHIVFGAYTVTDEDRVTVENEILLVEVKKVRKAIAMYQEKCLMQVPASDATSIYDPLASYLDENLAEIVFVLTQRKQ